MKRILSLWIVLSLLLSFGCIASASENNMDVIENRYKILQNLDILIGREPGFYTGANGEEDTYRDMSKSSFINFLCNISGDHGYTEEYNEDALLCAEGLGLIHKGQEDLYKPLSFEEAVTMIVRLLGYETHAQQGGGFPHGYTLIAKRLGITDGVTAKGSDTLKEYEAVNLLYNTINTAYVEIAYISEEEGVVYGNASDSTILYEFRKIYRIEGVVEATGVAALRTGVEVKDGKAVIDSYTYNAEKDLNEYLGMQVEAYVKANKNGEDTVLFAIPVRNREMTIQNVDICDVSADCRTITYLDSNGNEKRAYLSAIAPTVYNGQALKMPTRDDFLMEDGELRLIDNDDDSKYDVAMIYDYKTIVVDYISLHESVVTNIYQKSNPILSLKAADGDRIRLYRNGEEIYIDALAHGDVLRVLESNVNGKRIVTAYVASEKFEGTISTVRETSMGQQVTIDGVEYYFSSNYIKALADGDAKARATKPGSSYTFYLDNKGKIAYIDNVKGANLYAIVYATASDGSFGKEYKIKLFTTEGTWEERVFADKVKNNISGDTNPESFIDLIPNACAPIAGSANENGVVSVIEYTLNAEGKISSINLPEAFNAGNDGRFNVMNKITKNYRGGNQSMDSTIFIDSDPVYWQIYTDDLTDLNAYSASTSNVFDTNGSYNVSAYKVDEYGFAKMLVVHKESSNSAYDMNLAELLMVEDVVEIIDENGSPAKAIIGANDKFAGITYPCGDETLLAGLERGDAISVLTDASGYITQLSKYRDASEIEKYQDPIDIHVAGVMMHGKIDKLDISNLRVRFKVGKTEEAIRYDRLRTGIPVIIYDSKWNKIRIGSLSDLVVGDNVAIKYHWDYIWSIFVYR